MANKFVWLQIVPRVLHLDCPSCNCNGYCLHPDFAPPQTAPKWACSALSIRGVVPLYTQTNIHSKKTMQPSFVQRSAHAEHKGLNQKKKNGSAYYTPFYTQKCTSPLWWWKLACAQICLSTALKIQHNVKQDESVRPQEQGPRGEHEKLAANLPWSQISWCTFVTIIICWKDHRRFNF